METSETTTAPPLLAPSGADRCISCDARLAVDQRYCVECGHRRSPARFPGAAAAATAPGRGARRRSLVLGPSAAGTTLVAGVGTLLLALGIGVLIGRSGDRPVTASRTPVQVITVAGAGGVATAAAPDGTTAKTPKSAKRAAGKRRRSAKAAPTGAGSDVAKAVPKAVVKPGTPGKGPGYEKGKFTGNFFGSP